MPAAPEVSTHGGIVPRRAAKMQAPPVEVITASVVVTVDLFLITMYTAFET